MQLRHSILGVMVLAPVIASLCAHDVEAASTKPTAAFVMTEGGDTLTFFPPETVRLVRPQPSGPAKVCQTDLPQNGNMWGGRDVAAGFAAVDVQRGIAANATHKGGSSASGPATTVASYSVGANALKLDPSCSSCVAPPTAVVQFDSMMRGVLMNRRLLCP